MSAASAERRLAWTEEEVLARVVLESARRPPRSSSAMSANTSAGAAVATMRWIERAGRRRRRRGSARCGPVPCSRHGSNSTTTGAWSDGVGLPLRALRSTSDHTARSAIGARGEHQVDAQAAVLVEVAGAVVPPRVQAVAVVVLAEDVDEAPVDEAGERGPLGGRDVGGADELGRVVDVAVVGGDVEVAADDHVGRRVAPRVEVARRAGRATRSLNWYCSWSGERPLGT